MSNINLTNEEKFKLAVQLAGNIINGKLASGKPDIKDDKIVKYIVENYQNLDIALKLCGK